MLATNFTSLADVPDLNPRQSSAVVTTEGSEPESKPPPESISIGERIGDAALAPFRGVAHAAGAVVGGVYNIAATLDHFAGDDTLPTWDSGATMDEAFGHSKTAIGSFAEGLSQFLIGFVPIAGQLSKIGYLTKAAGKLSFLGNTVAGGVTTLSVFEGQQGRLSDLINDKFPSLKNPVTEFLASDPNDGEAVGRLKNVVEGLGLGAAFDGLLVGLRAMKRGGAVKAAGGTEAEVQAAIESEAHPGTIKPVVDDLQSKSAAATIHDPNAPAPGTPDSLVAKPELVPDAEQARVAIKHWREAGEMDIDPRVVNIEAVSSDKDLQNLMANVAKVTEEDTLALKGDPLKLEAEIKIRGDFLKDTMSLSTDRFDALLWNIQQTGNTLENVHRQLGAYKIAQQVQLKRVWEANRLAYGGDAASKLNLTNEVQRLAQINNALTRPATATGRALWSLRKVKGETIDSIMNQIGELGGIDSIDRFSKRLTDALEASGDSGAAKMLNKDLRFFNRFLKVHNEYWMNSILSGPSTAVANVIGNGLNTLYLPLERAVGAYMSGDVKLSQAFMGYYGHMFEAHSAAMKMMVRSIREGGSIVDSMAGVAETSSRTYLTGGKINAPAITAEAFGADNNSAVGSMINLLGTVIRTPNRMLTGADEYFKVLNGHAAAKTRLTYEAMNNPAMAGNAVAIADHVRVKFSDLVDESGQLHSEAGVTRRGQAAAREAGLTDQKFIDFVEKYTRDNYDPNASSTVEYARAFSQEATFTTNLPKPDKDHLLRGIPYRVQQMAIEHPILRLVVPFIRTPVNIIKFTGQRFMATDSIPLLKELHAQYGIDMASKDPMVRAAARGRQALGVALFTSAGIAGASGMITGGGPTNPDERKQLLATGWQPYSIKAPDGTYVSFQRMDPFATFLGLAGDFSEAAHRANEADSLDFGDIPSLVGLATARNITNKSYLTGISQMVEALSDPDRYMSNVLRRQAGSYVPNFLAQGVSTLGDDPYLREVRSAMDAIKRRVPGFGDGLDVQRNILGEPVSKPNKLGPDWVSPIAMSNDNNDPVFSEIAKFHGGLSAPRSIQNGIDFTEYKNSGGNQSAYDRWQQLTGEVKMGNRSLRQALEKLIGSASYQNLSDKSTVEYDSPRVREVRRIVNKYRYSALDSMLKEFPELNANWKQNFQNRAALQRGVSVEELMPLPFPK